MPQAATRLWVDAVVYLKRYYCLIFLAIYNAFIRISVTATKNTAK